MKTTGDRQAIEEVFLANRRTLLRFLQSRGVTDAAEDILHEMWLRLSGGGAETEPVRAPLSYLYRMANSLVVDRHRQRRQAERRDLHWAEANDAATDRSEQPAVDREMEAKQMIDRVVGLLDRESERARRVFWMHRIDGCTQREVAARMRISVSTVEGDLRKVYRLLATARELWDKAITE